MYAQVNRISIVKIDATTSKVENWGGVRLGLISYPGNDPVNHYHAFTHDSKDLGHFPTEAAAAADIVRVWNSRDINNQ
jgi:hypothetical protein